MCGDLLGKLRADHPRIYGILKTIGFLVSIGIILYTPIFGGQSYIHYIKRDQYSVRNISGKYYVYKTNLIDPINCPNRSAFLMKPSFGIYPVLVWNHPIAIIFHVSFWIAAILTFFILLLMIKKKFTPKKGKNEVSFENLIKIKRKIYRKPLETLALIGISFPLSIVDYSQLCVEYDSEVSFLIMNTLAFYPVCSVIVLPFMIYDMILTYRNTDLSWYSKMMNSATKKENEGFRSQCLAKCFWLPHVYIIFYGYALLTLACIIKCTRVLGFVLTIYLLLIDK